MRDAVTLAPMHRTSLAQRIKAAIRTGFGLQDSGAFALVSAPSASGKVVTANSALQIATVWACIRLLAETVGTLPLMLYRTLPDGSREVFPSHPLYQLLHDAPNADHTAVEFWEGVVIALCLGGNAYAEKLMIGQRLVALQPMVAERVSVDRDEQGARRYRYNDPVGGSRWLREDQVFHVRGFGGAGDKGLSPIAFARQSMGSAIAADELSGSIFANGARPSGILTIDRLLTPEQRGQVRENIVDPFTGSGNAGGIMVLEAGLKFSAVSMTPEDSQFLETRQFNVEELCRWFRVPPFMIGHTDKGSNWGTGLEQQMIGFLTFALRPYLMRIEQAIARALMTAAERLTLKAEFKVEGLLRADSASRAAYMTTLVQNGLMTRNEARRLENMPPLPGGDVLTVQAQNVPLGADGATEQPERAAKAMTIQDVIAAVGAMPAPVVNVEVKSPDITVNTPEVRTGPVNVDINTEKKRQMITEKRVTGYDGDGRIIAIEERQIPDDGQGGATWAS